ncbi:hypothetical protein EYZ11_006701 [Aspergillus tanneri]|uniref:Uncharacterized protein n=1 Tax=Aspergillus tanneri TaxID=1220188 RepID=A0A4S3JF37_9EURO|nr:uncharacterized protein ATNIH1004_000700 [Aspergillus tanneri]KAA8651804.1 hypothetical protein ATNIH1004_000700 [Aspergillus tanneri]THC93812.1 hypothetical protein EYZ11_006701 [Aspergillus tanneri]
MGLENDDLAVSQNLQTLSFGITFPVTCILCILVLVQRIRRQPQGRFAPSQRQMDPSPSSPDMSGGKEQQPVGKEAPYFRDPSYNATTKFPSACDILQPLSQLAPLPSSGYLAAVLGRERRDGNKQSYPEDQTPTAYLGSSATSSGGTSRPATSDTNESSYRSGSISGGSDASRRGSEDPQQIALSPTGWRIEGDPEEFTGLSGSEGVQSVQKRSQTVQYLYDVDDERVRTWKRMMVEYH